MSPLAYTLIALLGCFALPRLEASTAADGEDGKTWVFLAAPTKGYEYYHTQASICHAYHIFKKNGVPPEQIIVMMYDDVATDPQNPYPHNLKSEPNGTNVREGCVIDYKAGDVTARNFMHVVEGDQTAMDKVVGRAGSKVIKSGPNDDIFIYVTGSSKATGTHIFFPKFDGVYPGTFATVVYKMQEAKKFNKMMMYMEGNTMQFFFAYINASFNVFGVTNTNEFQDEALVFKDEKRKTYLNDMFSFSWMRDTEQGLAGKTVTDQFFKVQGDCRFGGIAPPTTVLAWGNMSIGNMKLASFMAGRKTAKAKGWL